MASQLPSDNPPPRENSKHEEAEHKNEHIAAAEEDDVPPRSLHGVKWFIAVVAILSSTLLFSLDNTVVADIQPSIVNDFGSVDKLPWLGAAFGLGSVSILPWSRAYGVFNVKWLYCAHVLMFEVGSAICGAAPNMDAMIVGRTILGAGGAGMYVGCLTYIAVSTSPKEKPQYLGMVGLVWAFGTVLGPVVGGAFASSTATWRWAFYINLVIGGLLAPAYLFLLPNTDFQRGTRITKKLAQMDWLGIVVFDGAMACFVMAINFGGSLYDWNSGREIALWVMAGVLFIAFGITQWLTPLVAVENKLYPTHFLRKPVLLNLQLQLFSASGILFGAAYYIPLYFQFARGDSPLTAAVRLLPYIFMVAAFALINGAVMSKTGYYMPWYAFGGALVIVGSALMYTITPDTNVSNVYGYTVLIGVGVGCYIQAGYSVAQCQVPVSETSNVIGFMSIGQAMGIIVFFSVIGTTYHSKALAGVQAVLPNYSPGDVDSALAGTSSRVFSTLQQDQRKAVIAAVIKAMSVAWATLIAGGACTLIGSLFLRRNKFYDDAKQFTD